MTYDLTVAITIRRKDECRDSLEVREQGVVLLGCFPEIAAVVQRFHELLEDVTGPSPAVPKTGASLSVEFATAPAVEKGPETAPSE